jgi:MFS transporter, DHA1 family, tetracycline resistance protein
MRGGGRTRPQSLARRPEAVEMSPQPVRPEEGVGAPRGALLILFLTVFIDLVGFGIVIPLLPLYAEDFGASPITVTWLVAVFSLMQFLFAPWWGQLSDRHGRRPILLIGLFGSAISYLLFGLAGTLVGLFVGRILAGVMGANVGVAQAYIADVTSLRERARGMGLIGAAFGLGFIFGPVIGGGLSHFGPSVPFFGAAALALVNGLLALVLLPESLRPELRQRGRVLHPSISDRFRLLRKLSRETDLGVLYLAFFLITFAFAALEATLSLWADRRWALSPAQVAYLFAYLGVVVTIVQGGMVGPLARRLGERKLAMVGSAAFAVGLVAMPLAPNPLLLAIALAVLAFGQGTAMPSVSALISRNAPSTEQGRLLGLSQSLSALGRVIGPVWGGIAFARLGIGAPYHTGAVLVGMALISLAMFMGHRRADAPVDGLRTGENR